MIEKTKLYYLPMALNKATISLLLRLKSLRTGDITWVSSIFSSNFPENNIFRAVPRP
jgi:hypothetical protein